VPCGGCSHHPHPPLPRGLSCCFLRVTQREHSGEERHIFISPFGVFKAVSSWEDGLLCCWALSCLWERERGLEPGWGQRGAGGCRQRTPWSQAPCAEHASALLKHGCSSSSDPSATPCPPPAPSTHGCAPTAWQAAQSTCRFPASRPLHHAALPATGWKTCQMPNQHRAGAKWAPAAKCLVGESGQHLAGLWLCHAPPAPSPLPWDAPGQRGPQHLAAPQAHRSAGALHSWALTQPVPEQE